MANREEHLEAGLITGFAVGLYDVYINKQSGETWNGNDFAKICVSTFAGAIGGNLPDMLEPATSPTHRKTMHSYSVGALITAFLANDRELIHRMTANLTPDQAELIRVGLKAAGYGYLSHLVLDATTPAGLPLV